MGTTRARWTAARLSRSRRLRRLSYRRVAAFACVATVLALAILGRPCTCSPPLPDVVQIRCVARADEPGETSLIELSPLPPITDRVLVRAVGAGLPSFARHPVRRVWVVRDPNRFECVWQSAIARRWLSRSEFLVIEAEYTRAPDGETGTSSEELGTFVRVPSS